MKSPATLALWGLGAVALTVGVLASGATVDRHPVTPPLRWMRVDDSDTDIQGRKFVKLSSIEEIDFWREGRQDRARIVIQAYKGQVANVASVMALRRLVESDRDRWLPVKGVGAKDDDHAYIDLHRVVKVTFGRLSAVYPGPIARLWKEGPTDRELRYYGDVVDRSRLRTLKQAVQASP